MISWPIFARDVQAHFDFPGSITASPPTGVTGDRPAPGPPWPRPRAQFGEEWPGLPLISISAASPRDRSTVLWARAMEGVGFTVIVQTIGATREKFLLLFRPAPSRWPRLPHPQPSASWRRLPWRCGPTSPAPRPGPLDNNPRAFIRAPAHARVLDSAELHVAADFRARTGRRLHRQL